MVGSVTGLEFFNFYGVKLLKSYTALKIKFKFPDTVKYPNLPVRLDLNSVIFPLEGETFCTGLEFYLAIQLQCQIEILGGVYIPFKPSTEKDTKKASNSLVKEIFVKDPRIVALENQIEDQVQKFFINSVHTNTNTNKKNLLIANENENEKDEIDEIDEKDDFSSNSNFYSIVKELLTERLKYSKGSYMNLLYKFLANSGIGQMARGLNQKVRYDSHTNSTKILSSGDLVSPLYAG